jgi:hypothetical protein
MRYILMFLGFLVIPSIGSGCAHERPDQHMEQICALENAVTELALAFNAFTHEEEELLPLTLPPREAGFSFSIQDLVLSIPTSSDSRFFEHHSGEKKKRDGEERRIPEDGEKLRIRDVVSEYVKIRWHNVDLQLRTGGQPKLYGIKITLRF